MPGKRKSIRLKNYDYAQQGAYYVTLCVNDRKCVFGDVNDGEMVLNDAGDMVKRVWDEIPQFYDEIDIDHLQIMPNHIHGIINIVGAHCNVPFIVEERNHARKPQINTIKKLRLHPARRVLCDGVCG